MFVHSGSKRRTDVPPVTKRGVFVSCAGISPSISAHLIFMISNAIIILHHPIMSSPLAPNVMRMRISLRPR